MYLSKHLQLSDASSNLEIGSCRSSLATSFSPSALIWSDNSSQSSDASSVTSDAFDSQPSPHLHAAKSAMISDSARPLARSDPSLRLSVSKASVASNSFPQGSKRHPNRKIGFVDNLVDSSAQMIEAIWLQSSASCSFDKTGKKVLPLRSFIQETLRRSRTSYSTLQVTLYYLILVKPHVPGPGLLMERKSTPSSGALHCGRRMFLAALILASKYLQDRNYSARTWSKISGLNVAEINRNEIAFLIAVNWKLHITDKIFQRWTDFILKYASIPLSSMTTTDLKCNNISSDFKSIVLALNPLLENIDRISPRTHMTPAIISPYSPQFLFNFQHSGIGLNRNTCTLNLAPSHKTPYTLEPSPSPAYSTIQDAAAFGLLTRSKVTRNNVEHNPSTIGPAKSTRQNFLRRHQQLSSNMSLARPDETLRTPDYQSIQSHNSYSIFPLKPALSSSSVSSDAVSSKSIIQESFLPWEATTAELISASAFPGVHAQVRMPDMNLESSEYNKVAMAACYGMSITHEPILLSESSFRTMTVRNPSLSYCAPSAYSKLGDTKLDEKTARALEELHSHPICAGSQSWIARGNENKALYTRKLEDNFLGLSGEPCWQSLPRKRSSSDVDGGSAARSSNMNSDFHQLTNQHKLSVHPARKRVCCAAEVSLNAPQSGFRTVFGVSDNFGT